MGLFDIFKRDRPKGDDGKPADRKLESLTKKASDKRSQAYDRDEALRALVELGTAGAAEGLLKRFNLKVDPSITDQEEKQLAFDGIVSIGRGQRGKRLSDEGRDSKEISSEPLTLAEVDELRDAVVAAARRHCEGAENLTWGLKVIRALLDDAAYEAQLLDMLGKHDTEYTRNVEPKLNLLAALEDVKSEAIREAVEAFLGDVNETVRFHAVQTAFAQGSLASLEPMVRMLADEESVRVKNKVAEGIRERGWVVPEPLRDAFAAAMRDVYEYRLTGDFRVEKI
jgi:hypothetical protein